MPKGINQYDVEGFVRVEHRPGGLFVGFLHLLGKPRDELVFVAGGDGDEVAGRRRACEYAERTKTERRVRMVEFFVEGM